jgi:hypothetical protein
MKKEWEQNLTYFGDPLCNFFITRGIQLDNGVDPRALAMG